jgi:predicted adenylyl cyclase CyaB
MIFEVEHKARLPQPAQTEALVVQLGVFEKETHKEDIYFRRHGDTSSVPADRFRLRQEEGRALVTFKQGVSHDGVEINQETEFEVDDTCAFFHFTDRFGFEPFVVKRKRSRVYKVGRAHVELNEVEHLGHFIEVEILCRQETELPVARTEIARLFNALGVPGEDLERRPYIQMIQEAYPVQYRFVNDKTLAWPFEEIV